MTGGDRAVETVLRQRDPGRWGAEDLRRQQGVFGTAAGHGVSVCALALAGTGDRRALPAPHTLADLGPPAAAHAAPCAA